MKCLFCKGLNFNQLIERVRFFFGAISCCTLVSTSLLRAEQCRGIPLPSGLGFSHNFEIHNS
jgi:hypothetical protein